MTTLYLIRHAETQFNRDGIIQGWSDAPLTSEGEKAVKKLATAIRGKFDVIYSSSSMRAIKTALFLCEDTVISEIQTKPELKEIHLKPWEGKKINEIKDFQFPSDYNTYKNMPQRFKPISGENLIDAQKRIVLAVKKILAENKNRIIVIISHGGVISALLNYYNGANICDIWKNDIKPASLSELFFDGDSFVKFGMIGENF